MALIAVSGHPGCRFEEVARISAHRLAFELVNPAMTNLTDDLRARTLKSALGPIIDGTGAMARLAYHPGYHQGQVYMIKTAPGFPAA